MMQKEQEISEWMVKYLSKLLSIDVNQVETNLSFDNYGLDSLDAAQLTGELGDWVNLELEINVIYDYPSIDELSRHLAGEVKNMTSQWVPQ